MRKLLLVVLLAANVALLIGGCSWFAVPRPSLYQAEDDFAQRLRWLDFAGAARHLEPEYQEAFRSHFAALDGLHITDVRFTSGREADPQQVQTQLEVDYYRLPSVTLQTRHLHLTWRFVDLGRWQQGYWQIVGPFPDFP